MCVYVCLCVCLCLSNWALVVFIGNCIMSLVVSGDAYLHLYGDICESTAFHLLALPSVQHLEPPVWQL